MIFMRKVLKIKNAAGICMIPAWSAVPAFFTFFVDKIVRKPGLLSQVS